MSALNLNNSNEPSQTQQSAWDGCASKNDISSSSPHPLFLALSRWGKSQTHGRILVNLWQKTSHLEKISWGDPVWGGSLTLLDFLVDKQIRHGFKRCKKAGIEPSQRTWNMALIQDDAASLCRLVFTYGDPGNLPENHPNTAKALSQFYSWHLKTNTPECSESDQARRL